MKTAAPIDVLVVDDSAVMRGMLAEIINAQADLRVVGAAGDPYVAREKIKALNPRVLTLDVTMPRMDGITFLEKLMCLRPMPVIMVSSLVKEHADVTLRALELGAVDFVTKPAGHDALALAAFGEEVADKIRAAACARLRLPPGRRAEVAAGLTGRIPGVRTKGRLIVIGASTGGIDAVRDVLVHMPADAPPILVVQHMPELFTAMFAERMDAICRIRVKEAQDGERALPGHAYVAPGHSHMLVERAGAGYVIRLSQADPVNRHRPSVDVLFHAAAVSAGRDAVGVILTGMGADGAEGIRALKRAGAYNYAQSEASCVVFGMPKAAIATGSVDRVAAPAGIAQHLLTLLHEPPS
ncbi:chemotaxis response regulator protein-glutamate methylesterase [Aromatoleum toluclasticum]|uniref:protein-glutamate methylesterase/protein-glutamine glutaminase n=1 Tax=Aromatoleum toluclasticum TaxID=92003 RepID=UPI001D187142|nr:chemotaxis response regulator protein-glutamate methylesterase [Aromatoleum toluclasticum]MCC4114060.1 chemotaxis response regulator protein-glutamate methylesterase [Aromatoleum toluclasticum]